MSSSTSVPRKQRKFCVLGSRSAGKSCCTIQFVDNHFVEAYNPTIDSVFSKVIKHRGQLYDCEIIDTAGIDEQSIFHHTVGIDGYVMIYDVTDMQSFLTVQAIHDSILNSVGEDIPRILVGNKCDLVELRQVSSDMGQKFADDCHISFFETSARTNMRIAESFLSLLEGVERHRNGGQPLPAETKSDSCIIL